jgi:peptidoglycan/xylan/chitin deacetylase (PgdA/CDA1 family)
MSKRSKILRGGTLAALAAALTAVWLWSGQNPDSREAVGQVQLPDGPFVALTFDDGPRAATTTTLLDGLSQRGVHATFFVIGENVAGNEELLLRMEREGHQIGLHTFHHRSLAQVNGADFYVEVDQLREFLSTLLGRENFMLRPPFGMITPANRARAGSPIILWSVDPEDWSDRDSDRQVSTILDNVEDGGIILLHDIYPASVETALRVVDELMAEGYKFVTVEELFILRGQTPENGKEYRCLPPQE